MKVFVDTWGWVALADRTDPYHKETERIYKSQILIESSIIITSDYIFSETLTALRTSIGHTEAIRWATQLMDEVANKTITLMGIDENIWHRAFHLLQRYSDKPTISFVNFTSFVVMQELQITEVFSGDKHFEQVNLGFHLMK
ncbi:MAG: PIN domain-containing protein [Ignavibacteriae bacterium]|nr:PIN domain-containing protein [Ignavibacteriota bacterium]